MLGLQFKIEDWETIFDLHESVDDDINDNQDNRSRHFDKHAPTVPKNLFSRLTNISNHQNGQSNVCTFPAFRVATGNCTCACGIVAMIDRQDEADDGCFSFHECSLPTSPPTPCESLVLTSSFLTSVSVNLVTD